MTYLQAIVIGLLQGVTELFPVSSLGHVVVVPALIGGSWAHLVTQVASSESPYLAFVVGLHVATALALILVFRSDWARIIRALFASLVHRRISDRDEKLAWLIVVATIPVGLLGLVLEHSLRTLFAKPLAASLFLMVNGVILLAGERFRRRAAAVRPVAPSGVRSGADASVAAPEDPGDLEVAEPTDLRWRDAVIIGIAQSAALLAGISRDGMCMVAGLVRGFSHEEAARFAFCCRRRRSSPRACSRSPTCSDRWVTASARRSCAAASPRS